MKENYFWKALKLECPDCHAVADQPCEVSAQNGPIVHEARWQAAKKAADQRGQAA